MLLRSPGNCLFPQQLLVDLLEDSKYVNENPASSHHINYNMNSNHRI